MDLLIQDIQVVTGRVITVSGCPVRIGTFLYLSFDLFGSSMGDFPAAFPSGCTLR